MADIDPTRINQQKVDSGQELTPDGAPITQSAAPVSAPRVPASTSQPNKGIESIKDLPVDDGGKPADEIPAIEDGPKEPSIEDFFASKAVDESPLVDKTKRPDDKPVTELKSGLETDDVNKVVAPKVEVPKVETQKVPAFKDNNKLAPRDVTGIPDDVVEHFKNDMSRPAFEKVKPLILERQQLKQQLEETQKTLKSYKDNGVPESYYEHPNAFLLHPDYMPALESVDKAQRIVNHWNQQYAAVKQGAAEFDVIDVDPQSGNLYISGKMKADQNAEPTLMGAINRTQNQLIQQQSKLQSFAAIHKERSSQVSSWIDGFEKTDFPIFETSPDKDKYLQSVANIMKGFHPSLQGNPLARPLAKAKFVIATLGQFINQIKTEQANGQTNGGNGNQQVQTNQPKTREQLIAEQQRRAGPTSGSTGGHGKNQEGEAENGNKTVTVDDFNRVKEGY